MITYSTIPFMRKIYTIFLVLSVLLTSTLISQAQNNFFSDISERTISTGGAKRIIIPVKFRTTRVDHQALKSFLWTLPDGKIPSFNRNNAAVLTLPKPDGTPARFQVWEASIQEPGLEARFPEIRTFAGQGIDDPYATIRLDLTPRGFHAQVLSVDGTYYIDPYALGSHENYISYFRADLQRSTDWSCAVEDIPVANGLGGSNGPANFVTAACRGNELRTYRLAVANTGEYAQAPGVNAGNDPALLHAAIVTSVNRVVGVYEKELSVSMILVAENSRVEYLDPATDPFTGNNNPGVLLGESQTVIDAQIGTANYDVGHTFSTGAGGVATLRSPCGTSKARGVTGLSNPTGDAFNIDYVAHEMGHQFGGNHSFNGQSGNCSGGNRNGSTAYEPGSGTTIQGYAGICGADDIQPNSDPVFHAVSFDEIVTFVTTGNGGGCGVSTPTSNGIPVVVAVTPDVSIPISTPFTLTGTATDPNGDALTYSWEQWDLGPQGAWNSGLTSSTAPNFKSRLPKTSGSRTFPDMSVILAGYPANPAGTMNGLKGETLPGVARAMKFRLTVRDNRAGGGGVASIGGGGCQSSTPVTISVVGAQPFMVLVPNGGESYPVSSTQTVTWDVAGTNVSPVNVASVKISLSTDGGVTYPTVLAASTPNDGSETIVYPNILTTTARVKIEAIGNIFFDISNNNFALTQPVVGYTFNSTTPTTIPCTGASSATVTLGTTATGGFSVPIVLSATSGVPAGTTVTFSPNPLIPGGSTIVTLNNITTLAAGSYTINITGVAGTVTQNTSVTYVVTAGVPPNITTQPLSQSVCVGNNATFTVAATGVTTYQWQISTNNGVTFTNIPGANGATLTVLSTLALNGSQYKVVLSGSCFTSRVSDIATLTVNSPVSILTQPVNARTCVGTPAILTVNATSTSPQQITYQWQVSTNGGGTFVNVPGAINPSLTLDGNLTNNGNVYHVLVTGAPCGTVTSNNVTFTVNPNPAVTLVTQGATSLTPYINSRLVANINPAGGDYNYQWYLNGVLLPNAKTNAVPVNVDVVGEYSVTVTEVNTGCNANSNVMRITVAAAPSNMVFIYPNPSAGQFQVRYYSALTTPTTHVLTVYDSKGSRVYQKLNTVSRVYERMDVNLLNAGAGTYRVELRDATGKRLATGTVLIN